MPADWDDDKVKEVFGKFGTVTSTLVQADKKVARGDPQPTRRRPPPGAMSRST